MKYWKKFAVSTCRWHTANAAFAVCQAEGTRQTGAVARGLARRLLDAGLAQPLQASLPCRPLRPPPAWPFAVGRIGAHGKGSTLCRGPDRVAHGKRGVLATRSDTPRLARVPAQPAATPLPLLPPAPPRPLLLPATPRSPRHLPRGAAPRCALPAATPLPRRVVPAPPPRLPRHPGPGRHADAPATPATPRPARRRARQGPLGAPATRLSRPPGSDPVGAPSPPPCLSRPPRRRPGHPRHAPATPATAPFPAGSHRRARQGSAGRRRRPPTPRPVRQGPSTPPPRRSLPAPVDEVGLHLVALREPPARHAHAAGLGTATVLATPAPSNAPDIPSMLSMPPRRCARHARSPRSHARRCRTGFPRKLTTVAIES